MPRRVLELKFKGNRLVRRARRSWFCHLLEDGEELARNSEEKNLKLFVHDPPKNRSMLEEEKDMQDLT
jgi:hypothetical protein